MYTPESIAVLVDRIGWRQCIDTSLPITVDEENLIATSGRDVASFHSLATVENLHSAIVEVNMDSVTFNERLASFRKQAVLEVVTSILDHSELYEFDFDYSELIIKKAAIFDNAIGYTIAAKALELFITTSRKNLTERNASLSFQILKVELEGAKNDRGHFIAKGIVYKKEMAIQKAQEIIFPNPILIIGDSQW